MKISLSEYNEDWPRQFENDKDDILSILGKIDPAIEHVGSTSVHGLAAKPIIDITIDLKYVLEFIPHKFANTIYVYLPVYNE